MLLHCGTTPGATPADPRLMVPGIAQTRQDALLARLRLQSDPGCLAFITLEPGTVRAVTTDTAATPVGGPVGMVYDQSRRPGGSNLIVNGGFDTSDGWTLVNGATIADGRLNTAGGSNYTTRAYRSAAVRYGGTYAIGVTSYAASGSYTIGVGGYQSLYISPAALVRAPIVITESNALARCYVGVGVAPSNGWVDEISVTQIAGNHAFQATATNRPMLKATAIKQLPWLYSSSGTMALNIVFASAPGTCTIVRAAAGVPAVSAATIGQVYNIAPQGQYNGALIIFAGAANNIQLKLALAALRPLCPLSSNEIV